MASKPIDLHPAAAEEYEGAVDWYLQRSQLAAQKFAEELTQAFEIIAQSPHRWPKHLGDTRKFILLHFPFVIVYRELTSAIQIIAVAHGHRRPNYWKDRV